MIKDAGSNEETAYAVSERFMVASEKVVPLYKLSEEWNRLLYLMEEPDADLESIQEALREVAGDIREKAYGLAVFIQGLDKLAERQKFESDQHRKEVLRLADKAKATEKRAKYLREYALACMEEIGERRIETGVFTLAVRLNNPKVEVLDESSIPDDYWRQPVPPLEIDRAKLLDHWRATGGKSTTDGLIEGDPVPGVDIVRDKRLDIN